MSWGRQDERKGGKGLWPDIVDFVSFPLVYWSVRTSRRSSLPSPSTFLFSTFPQAHTDTPWFAPTPTLVVELPPTLGFLLLLPSPTKTSLISPFPSWVKLLAKGEPTTTREESAAVVGGERVLAFEREEGRGEGGRRRWEVVLTGGILFEGTTSWGERPREVEGVERLPLP